MAGLEERLKKLEGIVHNLFCCDNNQFTGPQGPPGPVGPAGLNWQGQWVSGTSYVEDDAVGHNGASWFCVNPTSGTTSPNLDTSNWALLAAQGSPGPQGAQGIQGIQGPTGHQGPAGPSGTAQTATQGLVTASISFPHPVLTNSLNQVLATADNDSRVVLPTSTAIVGQKVVVSCIGGHKLLVKAAQAGGGIYINGVNNDLVNEFYIYPNETYEFTYNDNAEWISYFEEPKAKYKSYIALINQSGTNAPVATVIYNDTGSTFTWNYDDVGSYIATSSSPILLGNKTVVFVTAQGNSGNNQNKIFGGTRYNDTSIGLLTSSDGILKLNFEIRVYN